MGELVDLAYWREELLKLQRISAMSIVEYCKAVYEFSSECESKGGGTTFTNSMKEWLGVSSTQASKLKQIGEKADILSRIRESLPVARESIHIISQMNEDLISRAIRENVINPEATAKEIKDFSSRLEDAKQIKAAKEQAETDNFLKRVEQDSIPDEELEDDGLIQNEDGSWSFSPDASTKEVSYSEDSQNTEELLNMINSVAQGLTYKQMEDVLDYMIKIKG